MAGYVKRLSADDVNSMIDSSVIREKYVEGVEVGGVGSYAFLAFSSFDNSSYILSGGIVSGGVLYYSSGSGSGSDLSQLVGVGSWLAVGRTFTNSSAAQDGKATVFLRVY